MAHEISFGERQEGRSYTRRTAVYAVILRQQRSQVATIKTERGLYFLPGGGIEPGEDHEACLRRELMEETGYQINVGRYIGCAKEYHMSVNGDPILGIGHFYLVELLDKLYEPVETGELTWLGAVDASKLLFLQFQAWAVNTALKDW